MITKRQKEVLDFISSYQKSKGYAPSLEEICKKFKLASVSTAHFHISKLRDLGYLTKEENKPRAIVVIRKQETADDGQTVVEIIDDNEATLKKIYREKKFIKLQPANQEMLPIYRKEVEVRGVVVKIIRNLENNTQDKTFVYKKKTFLDRIKNSNPNSQNKYKRVASTK